MAETADRKPIARPLQIDLKAILGRRIKGWKKHLLMPDWLIGRLEKIIRQKELNEMLRIAYPSRGHEFSEKILAHLGIEVETEGLENLEEGKAYVFASNHPLGGLDGIALVGVLGKRFGDNNLRVLVNDMLMNVEPLADVFLPINKYGSQGKASAIAINEAYQSGKQIVTFPAGLVSRLGDDGVIRDLQWQKAFAAKALSYGRDIVPIYFEGLNSPKFYKTARLRKKSGLKINLEQALLPGEVVKSRGKRFHIHIGKPIRLADLPVGIDAKALTLHVRTASDALRPS